MLKQLLILASCVTLLIAVTAFVHAATSTAPVSAPVQAVMTPYLQIHDALASDSLDGVSGAAAALAKAAQADKLFPAELSQEAKALAQTTDLASARAAFKPMSETLIKALSDNKALPAAYTEVYCPMEKAHWLQTSTTVSNPFGSSMARCGNIVTAQASSTSAMHMGGGCCN
ncbi:MAG TPA: DUF3347 domain-containing protein [Candidatus Methylacidiphilales bacterium]